MDWPRYKFWNHIVGRMSNTYTLPDIHGQDVTWTNVIPLRFIDRTKSGDEIFVGDIIQHGESIRFVEIRNGNATLTRPDFSATILLSFSENPKKLGNVFQNPELLPEDFDPYKIKLN